jgi:predicted ATP-grasp superfamily ATP-dependent carboligase
MPRAQSRPVSQTVLLTLGRLPKALDIARSFARIAWTVVVAEPHRRHLTGASRSVARSLRVAAPARHPRRYLDDLLAVVEAERPSLIVPVSEETLHVAGLKPLLPADVRLLTMGQDLVLALHDKGEFARRARAVGLSVPETFDGDDPEAQVLAANADIVLKPVHSCSGRGVRLIRRGEPLPALDGFVVQRFVSGEEFSTCTLARKGRVQATSVYRGTLMSGSVAVGFERVDHSAIENWVSRFVEAVDWSGFIAFDVIVDGQGRPWAIECNPRATSGLHFFDEGDLAPAILDPSHPLRFRPERRLQQFWSCLTETQKAVGDWPRFQAYVAHLTRTPDVTFRSNDPWPLIGMPYTAWPILSAARAQRLPFGQVATLDLSWVNGESASP